MMMMMMMMNPSIRKPVNNHTHTYVSTSQLTIHVQIQLVQAIMPQTFIPEVSGSNLGQDTEYTA
jgi:hypothetical protein